MRARGDVSARQLGARARGMLRVLALGAGVQSSTLLLMAARGELGGERPDVAIFADTGWEPKAVYRWLDFLQELVGDSIPILRVARGPDARGHGSIRDSYYIAKSTGKRFVQLPVFVANRDGTRGMARRQCTKEFKIEPIVAKVRELAGLKPGQIGPREVIVEQWFGISADEVVRMKDSRIRWIRHRYPLVDRGLTRSDCLEWWDGIGLPRPPKSACIGCPYTDDERWMEMRETAPDEFADAVEFDRMIRDGGPRGTMRGENFLHRSCIPLDEVEFGRDYAMQRRERAGQQSFAGWLEECEGMCGV